MNCKVLDWVEYLIRYDWIDGGGIWAQVLNREQNHSALLYIPLDAFEHAGNAHNKYHLDII